MLGSLWHNLFLTDVWKLTYLQHHHSWNLTQLACRTFKNAWKPANTNKWFNYDAHVGKELHDHYLGEPTVMRHNNKWTPAVIVQQHSSSRSYVTKTQSGKRYRRNRWHIKPTSATNPVKPEVNDTVFSLTSDWETATGSWISQSIISVPSSTCTRSWRSVVCPSKFKDFVKL